MRTRRVSYICICTCLNELYLFLAYENTSIQTEPHPRTHQSLHLNSKNSHGTNHVTDLRRKMTTLIYATNKANKEFTLRHSFKVKENKENFACTYTEMASRNLGGRIRVYVLTY